MGKFGNSDEKTYRIIDQKGNEVDRGLTYECAMLWIDSADGEKKYRMEEED